MVDEFGFDPAKIEKIRAMRHRQTPEGLELSVTLVSFDARELVVEFKKVTECEVKFEEGGLQVAEMIIARNGDAVVVGDELTGAYRWVALGPVTVRWM